MARWIPAVFPVLLGAIVWLLATNGQVGNPRVSVAAMLGEWIFLLGGLLTLLAAVSLAVWQWRDRVAVRARAAADKQEVAERHRFLQRLDHELKNPLMAVRAGLANVSEQIDSDDIDSSEQVAVLKGVDAQAVRLSRLTADLRKISELETRPLEFTQVDLTQLLKEAFELIQEKPEANERRLNLIVPEAPWPLPHISGDWDLLFLAFYNLLDNALKFTRPNDAVEVRAREDNATVVLEVADTGPGIEAAELDQVWKELYRGEGARSVTGSGLGLALVRAIVERHTGRVSLDSRAGQGTVVTIELPVQ